VSRIFSSPCHPDWLWGFTQLPIQWVPGVLSLGVVKQQGCEAPVVFGVSYEGNNIKECLRIACSEYLDLRGSERRLEIPA
jgi:hypothetical protein